MKHPLNQVIGQNESSQKLHT